MEMMRNGSSSQLHRAKELLSTIVVAVLAAWCMYISKLKNVFAHIELNNSFDYIAKYICPNC